MGGWTGKLLRVNLTTHKIAVEKVPEDWRREFIGGRGLAARYLYKELNPKVDPLSPDNVLIFATGPLTGTMASTSGRFVVVTKGPLTGAIA
jgi:aldehyde:ferredoxin oxidoreductase